MSPVQRVSFHQSVPWRQVILHSHGIIESPECTRCDAGECETVTYYLLKCDRYEVHRHNLMSSLGPVIGGLKFSFNNNNTHMLIDLLLNGSPDLLSTHDNSFTICNSTKIHWQHKTILNEFIIPQYLNMHPAIQYVFIIYVSTILCIIYNM